MMKFNSLTTPTVSHDVYNILTEFIYINKSPTIIEYPWRDQDKIWWGKTVSAIKKLTKPPFNLDIEQIAFYIRECQPSEFSSSDFAKIVFRARKFLRKCDVGILHKVYAERLLLVKTSGIVEYKQNKPKNIFDLLTELEA